MSKRTGDVNWELYYDALFRQQMDEAIIEAVDRLTGRALYEQSTISGTSKYLINRPVNYALHGTEINYPIEPQEVMRNCLIDGIVVLKVADPQHIRIQDDVIETEHDDAGDVEKVRIQYFVDPESQPDTGRNYSSGDRLMYREDHIRFWDEENSRWADHVIIYNVVKHEKDFIIIDEFVIPYWSYVSIRWINDESMLEPVKKAVIRLEGATVQIRTENVRHGGRKLFIVGMKREQNRRDPRETSDRVNFLPDGAEAYYVDSDTGSVSLMFEEQEKVEEFIERTTGVVSVKQLANLSADSKHIAETPLVQLAEEIRIRFTHGMESVVAILQDFFGLKNTFVGDSPELAINYQFLRVITDKSGHLEIIEKAVSRAAITPEEEITEYRRLLNLSNKDPVVILQEREEQLAALKQSGLTPPENNEENGNV